MHWIQRHILRQLATKELCRYKELKPENVDGNLFMYHLKQLINDRYLIKKEGLYTLTKEGKKYVAGLSLETGKTTAVPRIFAMVFSKNKDGKLLLFRWNRQPYIGHISLPFTRIRHGESITEAARIGLEFKTGQKGKINNIGVVNVIVKKDGVISTHYIAHLFELINPKKDLFSDGLTGQPFWENLSVFQNDEFVNGTKEIVKLLDSKKSPIFEEITLRNRD